MQCNTVLNSVITLAAIVSLQKVFIYLRAAWIKFLKFMCSRRKIAAQSTADITFIFSSQKGKREKVKCKLHPRQKQMHYTASQAPAETTC